MGLRWPWESTRKDEGTLKERIRELEHRMMSIEQEWQTVYDKIRKTQDRHRKREAAESVGEPTIASEAPTGSILGGLPRAVALRRRRIHVRQEGISDPSPSGG